MPVTRRRAGVRPWNTAGHRSDPGFTLAEVVVSLMLVTIVIAGITTFFISVTTMARQQGGRQVAVQAAQDAIEEVRALKPWTLLTGRVDCASASCETPVPPAVPYLAGTDRWGEADPNTALLPPSPSSVSVAGVTYARQWYVGKCWQPPAGGTCDATNDAGDLEFVRVVVVVTWADRACPAQGCVYADTTLISASTQPAFQAAPIVTAAPTASAPVITNPGNQSTALFGWVVLNVGETGGTAPFTWAWSGLPPGLHGVGGEVYGWPFATGTWTVTVTITDTNGLSGTATFTWRVS